MTYITREAAMEALFDLLKSSSNFQTADRRFQMWDQITGASCPALFMDERPEEHKRPDPISMSVRMLNVNVYIYIDAGLNQAIVPATQLNNLLDAIDPNSGGVLKPDLAVQNRQTLGGLVYDCWIDGQLIKVPGDTNGIGIAMIPIKVLLP